MRTPIDFSKNHPATKNSPSSDSNNLDPQTRSQALAGVRIGGHTGALGSAPVQPTSQRPSLLLDAVATAVKHHQRTDVAAAPRCRLPWPPPRCQLSAAPITSCTLDNRPSRMSDFRPLVSLVHGALAGLTQLWQVTPTLSIYSNTLTRKLRPRITCSAPEPSAEASAAADAASRNGVHLADNCMFRYGKKNR